MMTYSEMERELNEIPKFGAKASLSNLSAYLELRITRKGNSG